MCICHIRVFILNLFYNINLKLIKNFGFIFLITREIVFRLLGKADHGVIVNIQPEYPLKILRLVHKLELAGTPVHLLIRG